MCKKCANICPIEAEKNFRNRITELKCTIIGKYIDSKTPVECLCSRGHQCFTLPNSVKRDHMPCGKCYCNSRIEAEKNFHNRVAELNGKVIGRYVLCDIRVECLCPAGHKCFPHPSSIQRGCNMCIICSRIRFESKGSGNVRQYLTDNKIAFQIEQELKIICAVKRRYDFVFTYDSNKYIIEFDGEQHFRYTNSWHRDDDHFELCQSRDRTKSYCAVQEGYTIIRINNKEYNDIKLFMDKVLSQNNTAPKLYVDDTELYSYLLDNPVDQADVFKSCNFLLLGNVLLSNQLAKL